MVKFEQIGALKISKINPVMKLDKDVPNYSFQIQDGITYLILNTVNGDDSYAPDYTIKAGEFLNGYNLDGMAGHMLTVEKQHIKDEYEGIESGNILKVGEDGLLEVAESAPGEGVYFVVLGKSLLVEPAVDVRICGGTSKGSASAPVEEKISDKVSVMEQSKDITGLGKKASDLISADTAIGEDGSVTGTLNYISGWSAFSSAPEEQNGNFFPVLLSSTYQGQTIKVTGKHVKEAQDLEWILRVSDSSTTFKFETGGKELFTLNFKSATLTGAV